MSKILFLDLKNNLIVLGIPEEKFLTLEKFLIAKKGKIIFPEVLAKKIDTDYQKAQKILFILSKNKITKIFYRMEIPENHDFLDYDNINEIPEEIEINGNTVSTLDRLHLMFRVIL